jgi:hypothetical protein
VTIASQSVSFIGASALKLRRPPMFTHKFEQQRTMTLLAWLR